MKNEFEDKEMPYDILEKFGLSQEMIDDLPSDVLQDIYNGYQSPALPVHVMTDEGEEVKAHTRFRLVRKADDTVDVLFYPKLNEYDFSLFNEQQGNELLTGKAIIGYLENNERGKEQGAKCFFQIDPENKQVLSVPTPVIGRNIQYVADCYHLTGSEIQKIQNGEVLSMLDEDEVGLSVGIDLNARTGIRFAIGDEESWKREAKRDWDKFSFGIYGCWTCDQDGNLDYIPEEEYTDEMWNEQKKAGMRAIQR